MGEHGSLRISPIAMRGNAFKRELDANVPSWYLFEKRGQHRLGPLMAVFTGMRPMAIFNLCLAWTLKLGNFFLINCRLTRYAFVSAFLQNARVQGEFF